MRRVNIRYGLKQRMNDILGSDNGSEASIDDTTIPGITPWSIQSAIISNIQRVVSGVVGDAAGRPVRGLRISANIGSTSYSISSGIGFTKNGNAVNILSDITANIVSSGSVNIFLRYLPAECSGQQWSKQTNFVGKSGYEELVYDDFAYSVGVGISTSENFQKIIVESQGMLNDDNVVYIGTVEVVDGEITGVTNAATRGFPSASPSETWSIIGGLTVGQALTSGGIIYALAGLTVSGGSVFINADTTFGNTNTVTLPGTVGKLIMHGHTPISGTVRVATTGGALIDLGFTNGLLTTQTPV